MRKTKNREVIRRDLMAWFFGAFTVVFLVAVIAIGAYMLLKPEQGEEQREGVPEEAATVTEAMEAAEATKQTMVPIAAATEPTQPTEENRQIEEKARQILQTMSQDEKIYQLFIVRPEHLTGVKLVEESGEITREAIAKKPVGGVIYFSKNIKNRLQCQTMISNIQEYTKLGLFIGVDEEGNRISRIAKNPEMGATVFGSMLSIGMSENAQRRAYEVGYTIGKEIGELGFNLDFAPVADVFSNPANTVIGDRSFSTDPETAAQLVASCVKGFNDSNMLCTLKHFPGHGDTAEDSHYNTATTQKTVEQMRQCEFLPFQAGIRAGAPFVMVGHITATQLSDRPASLSREVITGLLREELGFDGLVITDAMDMDAITKEYSCAIATVMALQAGVDIVLMPDNLSEAVAGVQAALESGELTQAQIDEKVMRILTVKIEAGII